MRPIEPWRPVGVRLADVLSTTTPPIADAYISSCTNRADGVRPGDVYVAPDADAVATLPLVEKALAAGAGAVVVNQLLPVSIAAQFVVEDARLAFAEICHALVGSPGEELHTSVIAGGLGKSSVAGILRSIYGVAGKAVAVADGKALNDGCQTRLVDSPTPPTIARWLARSLANGVTHAVVESRSDRRLDGLRRQVLCVTNHAKPSRAGEHSLEDTRQEISEAAARLADDGKLVVSVDDPEGCRLLARHGGAALTFGFGVAADVRGRVIQRHTGGQVMLIQYGNESVAVETSTVGDAHAANCLAAAAVAIAAGCSLADAAAGIERSTPAPLVMQPVVCGQRFPVYLDAATSVDAVATSTTSVAAVTGQRLLTVLADGPMLSPAVLAAARAKSDLVVVPRVGGHLWESDKGVRCVEDRFAAIALALALADAGDAVVLLGCKQDEGDPAPEECVVRQLLQLRLDNEPELAEAA